MKANQRNIYSKMFNHFNGTTGKLLHLKIANTPPGDWGITRGSDANAQSYTLTVDTDINTNGSNLMKYVTLCHEMIHAYMWSTLEDEGLIDFDASGLPGITFGCEDHVPNLNAISVEERFVEVICAMQAAGTYNAQWTHELFNKNVFEIEDYRQALEDFLKNDYDWNSESQLLKNTLIQSFGTDWQQDVAGLLSWKGLTETQGFENWCIANGHTVTLNQEGFKTTPALGSIIGSFNNFGNKDCN